MKERKCSEIVEDFSISALSLESQSRHVLLVFPFCCLKGYVRRENGKAFCNESVLLLRKTQTTLDRKLSEKFIVVFIQ